MGPPGRTLTAPPAPQSARGSAGGDGPRGAIVLIGFMGAGKSRTARELAVRLGVRALDSDELLEAELGHSIQREFELHGEGVFREREERLVLGLLASARPGDVIALGGGSVLSERVREALGGHVTALLEVDPGTAWERVGGAGRPLARERERFAALHAERRPLYEGLADAFLPAQRAAATPGRGSHRGRRPGDLDGGLGEGIAEALRALVAAPPGTRLVWASSAAAEYPVLIGRGLLGWPRAAWPWPARGRFSRAFCVTDETVGELYAGALGELQALIRIPAGEQHKSLATAERVWQELVATGMTRADHVVALGGGVVGDLAGFCAATYQRGVAVVQIPTTLVAQVDAAYGGKTGVDLREAKNYVGAYHQPAAVMVDPETLATLPAAELAAGYAEVLKTALIAGGELWERVAADGPVNERMILACARTKLAVVAADERDSGARQLLNLGHTVGHAIETASGYARYRHGEAVGLGLLVALRLSGQGDLRAQVMELLRGHGLPVCLEEVEVERVLEAVQRDKKRLGESVPFVLVDAPGHARRGAKVSPRELRTAVCELL